MSKVTEELDKHKGNIWTAIISIRREDAERLGFNTGARWRDMLRTQTEALAKNLKITMENLRWYAAFHNESYHPHVHLIAYSTVENEGYLTQKVTIRGHLWYHQYEQKGGDAIDFVRRFYNKDYAEAVEMLLNNCGGQIITSPPIEKEHKPFELPPRNDRISRVFSYLLLTRGIDKDVLYEFVRRNMIFESVDFHNAVFVGYDSNGKPRQTQNRPRVKILLIQNRKKSQ